MSEDDKKKSGWGQLGAIAIAGFVCGVLTHLLIIIPIKCHIWAKLPKEYRRPWFDVMAPYGKSGIFGFIGPLAFLCYASYGVFWVFFLIMLLNFINYAKGCKDTFYSFHNPISENIANSGAFLPDNVFILCLFSFITLCTLAFSIWVARNDILETMYINHYRIQMIKKENEEEEERVKEVEAIGWRASQPKIEAPTKLPF
jgi:hypothetical protein